MTGERYVTELLIDFDSSFTQEEQENLEAVANRALQKCLEQVRLYSEREAFLESLMVITLEIKRNINSEGSYYGAKVQPTMDAFKDEQLIHHELIHVFQSRIMNGDQNLWSRVPKWFSEGMPVALSGQQMVYTREALSELLSQLPNYPDPESFLLMGLHKDYPMDIGLYEFWGSAFVHAISVSEPFDARYAKDDGPFLSDEQIARAWEIIKDCRSMAFDDALQTHGKKTVTPANVRTDLSHFLPARP